METKKNYITNNYKIRKDAKPTMFVTYENDRLHKIEIWYLINKQTNIDIFYYDNLLKMQNDTKGLKIIIDYHKKGV